MSSRFLEKAEGNRKQPITIMDKIAVVASFLFLYSEVIENGVTCGGVFGIENFVAF